MQLQNALKKLAKLGLDVKKNGRLYTAQINRDIIEFSTTRENDIQLIRVYNINDKDDFIADYCAGVWCKNLSQAIRFASN